MHKPDPVETILARLMPVAMSDGGTHGIEAMLDELAGPEEEPVRVRPWFRRPLAGGMAAAGIAAAVVLALLVPDASGPRAPTAMRADDPVPGFLLVGESGSIESISEEGWREDADGTAMRTLRLRVVEENQLLDEETGIVMLVSEPREEYLLMPVSAF